MRTANFKSAAIAALLSMGLLTGCTNGITNQKTSNHMDTLNLTQEWDKKFPQSDKVNHRKVTFKNRYGITLAADLYEPKNIESKLPAIAVSGPFGAVKEQSSGLYAQTMAETGTIEVLCMHHPVLTFILEFRRKNLTLTDNGCLRIQFKKIT